MLVTGVICEAPMIATAMTLPLVFVLTIRPTILPVRPVVTCFSPPPPQPASMKATTAKRNGTAEKTNIHRLIAHHPFTLVLKSVTVNMPTTATA
jgi:hypothetical protein